MEEAFDQFITGGFNTIVEADRIFGDYDHLYNKILDNKDAAILDVGCGTGVFLKWLEQNSFINLYGIDISSEMIEFCHKHQGLSSKCERVESIESFLANKKDKYDFIFVNDVIEHFPKESIIPTLKHMHKSLKTGGRLIVKTGNTATIAGFYLRNKDFTHYLGFTEYSLRQVLLVSGFKEVDIKGVYPRFVFRFRRIALIAGNFLIRNLYKLYYMFHYGDGGPTIFTKLIVAQAKK